MSKLDSLKSLIPAAVAVAAFCAGEKNAEAQAATAPAPAAAAAPAGFSVPFQTRVTAEKFVRWYRDTIEGSVGSTLSGKNQSHLTLQVPKGLQSAPGAGWSVEGSCPDPKEYARYVSGGKGKGKASGSTAEYMNASAIPLGLGRFKLQGGSSPHAGQIVEGAVVCETTGKDGGGSSEQPADKHTLTINIASVDVTGGSSSAIVLPAPPVDPETYSPPEEDGDFHLGGRVGLNGFDAYNSENEEHGWGVGLEAGLRFENIGGMRSWFNNAILQAYIAYASVEQDVTNPDDSVESVSIGTQRALAELLWHPRMSFLSNEDIETRAVVGGGFGKGFRNAERTSKGYRISEDSEYMGDVVLGVESGWREGVKFGAGVRVNAAEKQALGTVDFGGTLAIDF